MPFNVDCPTLSREVLGDEVFESEFGRRKAWLKKNCAGHFDGEGIRCGGILTGRRFKFELEGDAILFKMFFGLARAEASLKGDLLAHQAEAVGK